MNINMGRIKDARERKDNPLRRGARIHNALRLAAEYGIWGDYTLIGRRFSGAVLKPEHPVRTKTGKVDGYADLVVEYPTHTVVVEYKTGNRTADTLIDAINQTIDYCCCLDAAEGQIIWLDAMRIDTIVYRDGMVRRVLSKAVTSWKGE